MLPSLNSGWTTAYPDSFQVVVFKVMTLFGGAVGYRYFGWPCCPIFIAV